MSLDSLRKPQTLQGLHDDCDRVIKTWDKFMRTHGNATKPEKEYEDLVARVGFRVAVARRILKATRST